MEPNDRAERLSALPYEALARPDETTTGEPIWLAFTPELPGCMAQAETEKAALRELRKLRPMYIQLMIEDGLPVPPPALAAYLATWQHKDELEPEPETATAAGAVVALVGYKAAMRRFEADFSKHNATPSIIVGFGDKPEDTRDEP